MATCNHYYSAEDQDGGALGFVAWFDMYHKVGGSWVYLSTHGCPADGSSGSVILTQGDDYQARGESYAGWITPPYQERVACSPDFVLVYTAVVVNDYYVKVGGNDSLDGESWANAWGTIDKAATTLTDGQTGHIEVGTYSSYLADKIAPQNIGASGISYKPETQAGGAGTVEIVKYNY